MNKTIRKVALAIAVMMAALMINSSVSLFLRHDYLSSHESNLRVRNDEFAQNRGQIVVQGNVVIADTKPSNDSLKFQRLYPQAQLYANITGYNSFVIGRTMLERSYGKELAGTADSLAVQRTIDQLTGKPIRGATVELSINHKAQQAAAKALGSQAGAVVALDPDTGAVLALYSNPTFDPNQISSHDRQEQIEAAKTLDNDKTRPNANRAVREIYPPGSTFKVVVAAAALENGMKPDTMVDTPAKFQLPGTNSILTNQSSDCGDSKVKLEDAFRWSCNTSFAKLGIELGEEKLRKQAEKFGFGKAFLPELFGVESKFPNKLDKALLAQSSIGQYEVAATPLQMAMVAAAVANNGVVNEPYLVKKVIGPNLEPVKDRSKATPLGRAMSAENAKLLQQMMILTVESGSGTKAQIRGVKTGGKTGTAENAPGHAPYAWFVQFQAMQNSRIAVAVFVQEPEGDDETVRHGGYAIAAPISKAVMESLLS